MREPRSHSRGCGRGTPEPPPEPLPRPYPPSPLPPRLLNSRPPAAKGAGALRARQNTPGVYQGAASLRSPKKSPAMMLTAKTVEVYLGRKGGKSKHAARDPLASRSGAPGGSFPQRRAAQPPRRLVRGGTSAITAPPPQGRAPQPPGTREVRGCGGTAGGCKRFPPFRANFDGGSLRLARRKSPCEQRS